MTTRDTFLSLAIGASFRKQAEIFNYDTLNEYVREKVSSFLDLRGRLNVKEELAVYRLNASTSFMARLVEIGTPRYLVSRGLLTGDENGDRKMALLTAHAINISLAYQLGIEGVGEREATVFFDNMTLYDLIGRAIAHLRSALSDDMYLSSLGDL